jgi:rod shape-determining protein MreC
MYRREGRARIVLLAFVILAIFIITVDFRQGANGPLKEVKAVAVAVVAPIQRGFTAVTRPVGNFVSSLADLADLRSENTRLQAEVKALRSEASQVSPLEHENTNLRKWLKLDKRWTSMRSKTAQVISGPFGNFKWVVTIDKGRAVGIKPDMAVINLDGLVGKVIQSTPNTANVLLLIDPQAAAGARVQGVNDTGTVRGNGANEYLSLDFISKNAHVKVGDKVLTSGYDRGIFPAGIPIGTVARVSTQTAAVQSEILVQPAVDFSALDFVTVLLDSGDHRKPRGGLAR